jgi:hypothetical protein
MPGLTETIVSEVTNQMKAEIQDAGGVIKPTAITNSLHLSKSSEHGTPENIIELAREVLEGIDLDPFSNEFFNFRVKANRYFNQHDNALKMAWFQPLSVLSVGEGCESIEEWEPASVFLNPPSKLKVQNAKGNFIQKSGAKESWNKLIRQVQLNHVTHAIVIAYSLEQLQVTQKGCEKSMADYPFCIASERFDYVNDQGIPQTNGSHSSAIIYVPNLIDNSQKFKGMFSSIGKILNV